MSITSLLAELYSHQAKPWKLGLERVEELMLALGSPHKKIRCIHVAGTNGKGSVCAMIASILRTAGHKVGVYTSPHLIRFNERIAIGGRQITDEGLAQVYQLVKPAVREHHSFFEITTAMAFCYFAENEVEVAVIEVGLGGRLDATNVVTPLVSVITNISLEHQDHLGNTIKDIAIEKAGIIKKGVPVVTGATGKALEAIKKKAAAEKCNVICPKEVIHENGTFTLGGYPHLSLSVGGKFQRMNASIAVAAIEALGERGTLGGNREAIAEGLARARWPARFEYITDHILVDCAHNPAGAEVLARELQAIQGKRIIMVVGICTNKDAKAMIKQFSRVAEHIIFTRAGISRAANPAALAIHATISHQTAETVAEALQKAKALAGEEGLIVIAGSIYLVGEVISLCRNSSPS